MRGKYLFHLVVASFSIFVMAPTGTAAMTTTVSWSCKVHSQSGLSSPPSPAHLLQFTVAAQSTEIVSSGQLLFIDYPTKSLYRLDRKSRQCVRYSFQHDQQYSRVDSEVSATMRQSLAVYSVRESALWQEIGGVHCNKKTAIAGTSLLRHKTLSPKILRYLGEEITETIGEYWVAKQIAGWQAIEACLLARESAFADYPLLKRIDPLGLLSALGGFPVKGLEKRTGTTYEFALFELPIVKEQKLELPQECRADSL